MKSEYEQRSYMRILPELLDVQNQLREEVDVQICARGRKRIKIVCSYTLEDNIRNTKQIRCKTKATVCISHITLLDYMVTYVIDY